jgi:hypothetical protein
MRRGRISWRQGGRFPVSLDKDERVAVERHVRELDGSGRVAGAWSAI